MSSGQAHTVGLFPVLGACSISSNRRGLPWLCPSDSIRMAPLFAVILPLYVLFKGLGLLDTRLAVALAHLTLTLPLAVWMLMTWGVLIWADRTMYDRVQLAGGSFFFEHLLYGGFVALAPGFAGRYSGRVPGDPTLTLRLK